jgi:RNA polymerase sigma-70 factor (ECF subfamily)
MNADDALLDAARRGDRKALERFLAQHQRGVFRFGMKMCGTEEDAKDVLQETLIAAARTLPEFRGASSVSTWLYTIARSFCLKKRRMSKFAPERVESLELEEKQAARVPDPRRSPEEDAAGRQLGAVLETAIGELDPMYREVLVLRDVEGLSANEVAEVMGLTVQAVKTRLHRARLAVRDRVAPHLEAGADAARAAGAEAAVEGPGCADVALAFSRRLEGEIDAGACASLEQHLAGCTRCRGKCAALRETLAMCKRAGDAPVPEPVERSVREALRRFLEAHG